MDKLKSISLILGVFIMSFLVGRIVFSWTEPQLTPPQCTPGQSGCDAPINVGPKEQWKTGVDAGIGVLSAGSTFNLNAGSIAAESFYDANNNSYYLDPANTGYSAILAGKVGIGTLNPTYALDVVPSDADKGFAMPYKKNLWTGQTSDKWNSDINKDGVVSSDDLTLLRSCWNCSPSSVPPCWSKIIGVDNFGNYLHCSDTNINGDSAAGILDLAVMALNYDDLLTPYTLGSRFGTNPANKKGDINRDGTVDTMDVILLAIVWNCSPSSDPPCWDEKLGNFTDSLGSYLYGRDADVNGDGTVGIADLGLLVGNLTPSYWIRADNYDNGSLKYPALELLGETFVDDNNITEYGHNFYYGATPKNADAGKIGYGMTGYNLNTLDIIGGGTGTTNRIVSIYDKLEINGSTKIGTAGAGNNKALCWMPDKTIGYCSGPVDASGACTCNAIN